MKDRDLLATAQPCPFCAGRSLSLWQGAVTCDDCMAAGPFEAHFDGKSYDEEQRLKLLAVTRWNARACADAAIFADVLPLSSAGKAS